MKATENSITSLRQALADYTDKWGLVHNVPQDKLTDSATVSQNGICFTAEAYILMRLLGEEGQEWLRHVHAAVDLCWDPVATVLHRHPEFHRDGNQEQIDDFAGLAVLSAEYSAKAVYAGKARYWGFGPKMIVSPSFYFPNEWQYRTRFGWRAWMGRFPALIASLEWAAGERPPFWRRVWWGLAMRLGSVKTHDQARVARLLAYARGDAYWIALVEGRVREAHGSLERLYMGYFGTSDHPFVAACRKGRL